MRLLLAAALLTPLTLVACSKSDVISHEPAVDSGMPTPGPSATTPGADTYVTGTRLKRRVYKGADGSQQFVGWFDAERSVECTFQRAADDTIRCLPVSGFAGRGYYSDAACTSPLAVVSKGCTPPSPTAYVYVEGSCATNLQTRMFTMGEKYTADTVFQKDGPGGSCASKSRASLFVSDDFFLTGTEIPPTAFVEATEERL